MEENFRESTRNIFKRTFVLMNILIMVITGLNLWIGGHSGIEKTVLIIMVITIIINLYEVGTKNISFEVKLTNIINDIEKIDKRKVVFLAITPTIIYSFIMILINYLVYII